METNKLHRAKNELKRVGVGSYSLSKSETREIAKILKNDEHVLGAIYGQIHGASAAVVASTKRLIFVDVKPLKTIIEEISYINVADIRVTFGLAFAKVKLSTRPRNYEFSFVNQGCARKFMNALEEISINTGAGVANDYISKQLGLLDGRKAATGASQAAQTSSLVGDELSFLHKNSTAVVSTLGNNGYPYGATVYYFPSKTDPNVIRIITKDSTPTANNIRKKAKTGVTVTDESTLHTLHLECNATREKDANIAIELLTNFLSSNLISESGSEPPVTQIKNGGYIVIRLNISSAYLRIYKV